MISIEAYIELLDEINEFALASNQAQYEGVTHSGDDILMLVAGPGSGKTRVLVLRALRHVFVDGILPENILITTFTIKASKELRTRWLNIGNRIIDQLSENTDLQNELARIDLNRCRIDTLDSISQQILSEFRPVGELAPTVMDETSTKITFKRFAFSNIYRQNQQVLNNLLAPFGFEQNPPRNQGDALERTKTLCDRLVQDLVDVDAYAAARPGNQLIVEILETYQRRLEDTNLFDFPYLETSFLTRLRRRELNEWTDSLEAVLIDEYQDTNPLQEAIYFQMIVNSSPMVTIVGDDDQSMYRFRGGSVELFTQFADRCFNATGRTTRRVDMVTNYRSSDEIVQFYNQHISGDPAFEPARVTPRKPDVISNRGQIDMPVLGMFRESPEVLAEELSNWIAQLVRNRRINIGEDLEILLSEEGDLGDMVLLGHTIKEEKYNRFGGENQVRFPGLVRNAMRNSGLNLFNPRGLPLRNVPNVEILLGLILLCLDPDRTIQNNSMLTNESRFFFDRWRNNASDFSQSNPIPNDNRGLPAFIEVWQRASRGNGPANFPSSWPILELLFKLITWIPAFQRDAEHQVWLEAISRTLAGAGIASPYGMQIFNEGIHREQSRASIIRDGFVSIADDTVKVDEEIMPSVPRNYLQVMTIHQSKGLEFPLVIVDVGSHFSRNHPKQRFRRFPESPSNSVEMENAVENFLPTPLRGNRVPLDRTFDDLVRLYYVAYSRPQSILMLVGHEKCLNYGRGRDFSGSIPNICLGWHRDGSWPWRQPRISRRAPIVVDTPFLVI